MTTPRPWPEGAAPTAAQLLDYLRAITTEEELDRARVNLDSLLNAAERAEACILLDHDTEVRLANRRLTAAILEANRYRLAWLSARHRAANLLRELDR